MQFDILERKLEQYPDFVSRHSVGSRYNPEKGMEGLLSILTPDPKAVVLLAMEKGDAYFSARELYKEVLNRLEGIGLGGAIFPLTHPPTWYYCEHKDKEGNIVDGSLVDIGAVVKEVYQDTAEGLKTGYHISPAGELAIPLIFNAMEFVYRARNSKVPHVHDSMWRILGFVHSPTQKRRQLTVYKVVRFLIETSGYQRCEDIKEAFKGDIDDIVISLVLNALGNAGVIDYESPDREVSGKMSRGWVTYSLDREMSLNKTYEEIGRVRRNHPCFKKKYLSRIVEFVKANPDLEYESNELRKILKINLNGIASVLSALADIGFLKRESGFIGARVQSRATANDLTRMLYDIVLEPAWYSASTLTQVQGSSLNSEKVKTFLANYQEERSFIGPRGGEETRDAILTVLANSSEMKLSHIAAEGNRMLNRKLSTGAFKTQLGKLQKEGLVQKTKKGYYQLK